MNYTVSWENVYIFISSTFNDMHAERDYLIKRVFPAVREFCGEHRLNLLDVDLRWGITEEDAAKNKRVVEICLSNLDRCRPFFIGLLGQRRGWVPGPGDISAGTMEHFPGLTRYLGRSSITELELIHGIREPLAEGEERMRHAFLLRRDPAYLEDITDAEVRAIYDDRTVDADGQQGLFSRISRMFVRNRADKNGEGKTDAPDVDKILADVENSGDGAVSVMSYRAEWDSSAHTRELANVNGKDLSAGRLTNFRIGERELADYLTEALKKAIRTEYPAHFEGRGKETPLERELARQETALFHAADLYIPRPVEEGKIWEYLRGKANVPYLLTAAAGSGKTSLLAHMIRTMREEGTDGYHVFYRLAGTSADSFSAVDTLESIFMEMAEAGLVSPEEVRAHRSGIRPGFGALLEKTAREPIRIILDAVDQWNEFSEDSLDWLPETLPAHVRLVISMKTEGSEAKRENLRRRGFSENALGPLSAKEDKELLVRTFLSSFLKDINEEQMGRLIGMPGSDNPLYLKVILNELRLHGSFDTLFAVFEKNYGTTPKDAFRAVMRRLEEEEFIKGNKDRLFVIIFLGILANATEPVPFAELPKVFRHVSGFGEDISDTEFLDAMYMLARHLADFLVHDAGSVSFRYDSFRQAVRERLKGQESMFQRLLARLYYFRARQSGDAHYRDADRSCLNALAYHSVESGPEFTEVVLTDPWFVYALSSKDSSLKTASWFRKADEKGYSPEYGLAAGRIAGYAGRFDLGANPMFYTLYSGVSDSVLFRKLYGRSRKEMGLSFYYPAAETGKQGLVPRKEIGLNRNAELTRFSLRVWGNYLLQYKPYSPDLWMLDMGTGEVARKASLRAGIIHCSVEEDLLYVLYTAGGKAQNPVGILHLPDLNPVFYREDAPELPEGFRWLNFMKGIDGVYYRQAWKDGAAAESRLYRMDTGELVIRSVYQPEEPQHNIGGLHYELAVKCLLERHVSRKDGKLDSVSEHRRFWYIPGRRVFYESVEPGLGMSATDGKRLWFLFTDSRDRTTCHIWEETSGGMELKRREELDISVRDIRTLGAYEGILCIFMKSGELVCLDEELRVRNRIRSNSIVPTVEWYEGDYNRRIYLHEGQPAFLYKNRFCFFDRAAFEEKREESAEGALPEGEASRRYELMTWKGTLLFLSDICRRVDLGTLKKTGELTTGVPPFHYDISRVHRLGSVDVVFGTFRQGDSYYIQGISPELMKVVLRFGISEPGEVRVNTVFVWKNRVAVVFNHYIEREGSDEVLFGIKVNCYSVLDLTKPAEQIELPMASRMGAPLVCRAGDRVYLAISDVWADADHREAGLFDLESRTWKSLMTYEKKKHYDLVTDVENPQMFALDDEIYLPIVITSGKKAFTGMYVWNLGTGKHRFFKMRYGGYAGRDEERIYISSEDLYHSDKAPRKVCVYDLRTGKRIRILRPRRRESARYVMRKGENYLAFFKNDRMEVFRESDGSFRYGQYLPADYIEDCAGCDVFYAGDREKTHALYRELR